MKKDSPILLPAVCILNNLLPFIKGRSIEEPDYVHQYFAPSLRLTGLRISDIKVEVFIEEAKLLYTNMTITDGDDPIIHSSVLEITDCFQS